MKGGKLFMKFGLEQINEIVDKITVEKLTYQNSVIVGDNSSGKSMLLKKIMEKNKNKCHLYFIDAVNRGFDPSKLSREGKKPEYKTKILDTRLDEEYFNLKDSFNYAGTYTERIERIYSFYEKEVQDLFEKLTGDRFDVFYGEKVQEVDFGNGRGLLSSGYQAIIHVLLELLYYQDMWIEKQNIERAWVVIDEIDEFLSPKYSAKILEFLKKEFSWAKWIVTTHSCDLIAHTQNANLIVLNNSVCEVLDIDDYSSVSEVQIIFQRLFGRQTGEGGKIDSTLRRLLNNKINNAWGSDDEMNLKKLKEMKLTASQKMILKQIQEW
ncbi:MAG: hypothetical protein ACI4HI_05055 [Lachnospiraceae bacterium]